ncbi:MAG: stage II sporulation protein P [Oscillospiraceae bacterium]|nr:stage II sporulation protein P [Oscillospiraceae bacterium]
MRALTIRKALTAVLILVLGVGCVLAVKSSDGLRSWIEAMAQENRQAAESAAPETPTGPVAPVSSTESLPPFPEQVEVPETPAPPKEPEPSPVVLPTTIEGGMVIRNSTSFEVDLNALVAAGPSQVLPASGVQVLIVHTHGSESFTPDGEYNYAMTDAYHTADTNFNVVRLGDELKAAYESFGLTVIHDRGIYDTPSYAGSYGRTASVIEYYLSQYPEIAVVIDLHRDALGDGDVVYKTVAETDGQASSQIMMLVGTGENSIENPHWQENLKLALYMQSAIVNKYPSLARPITLSKDRYNHGLTTGSLILEVGSSGNTLGEALNAVRLFADATGPALFELSGA